MNGESCISRRWNLLLLHGTGYVLGALATGGILALLGHAAIVFASFGVRRFLFLLRGFVWSPRYRSPVFPAGSMPIPITPPVAYLAHVAMAIRLWHHSGQWRTDAIGDNDSVCSSGIRRTSWELPGRFDLLGCFCTGTICPGLFSKSVG